MQWNIDLKLFLFKLSRFQIMLMNVTNLSFCHNATLNFQHFSWFYTYFQIEAPSSILHSADEKKWWKPFTAIKYVMVGIGLLSPAIISAILFTWSPYKVQLLHFLMLPTILLFLSVLWIPHVQVDIVSSSDKLLHGRWKPSLFYAVIKILAIPMCLSVILTTHFQDLRSTYFFDFLAVGFREMTRFEVYFPIILIITSGFMVTFLGLIAVKVICLYFIYSVSWLFAYFILFKIVTCAPFCLSAHLKYVCVQDNLVISMVLWKFKILMVVMFDC